MAVICDQAPYYQMNFFHICNQLQHSTTPCIRAMDPLQADLKISNLRYSVNGINV